MVAGEVPRSREATPVSVPGREFRNVSVNCLGPSSLLLPSSASVS